MRSDATSKPDARWMRLALRLAERAYGETSPNPLVGAVLVKGGEVIGRGWHRRAGEPHAEIEAFRDAARKRRNVRGATLYVTLEPCCTQGRTPPCTEAIIAAGIQRVVVAATDPNPKHRGRGLRILRTARIEVECGLFADEAHRLNESFEHWIVQRTPFVTLKAAMTLDGKIATASGESKWITGKQARGQGMRLRQGADAILVGINTILSDDPSLTFRPGSTSGKDAIHKAKRLRRIVLDTRARTPLHANIVADSRAGLTTVVVSKLAPRKRVEALSRIVSVWCAPLRNGKLDLRWVLKKLGSESVMSLLVEGGGEVHASFLEQRLADRVVFFYAPMVLGGRDARKAVGGSGAIGLDHALGLTDVECTRLGPDLCYTARVSAK